MYRSPARRRSISPSFTKRSPVKVSYTQIQSSPVRKMSPIRNQSQSPSRKSPTIFQKFLKKIKPKKKKVTFNDHIEVIYY
jgi:hypothetical protein